MSLDLLGPLVCICIPTYNAQRTIKETLASLLAQTYRNIIIHVVDNASIDETVDLARSFEDPRIIIHTHAKNIGAEGNFNRCIALCEGEFTAIYHADDLYAPSMVQEQVQFLTEHPNVGGVLTEALVIDEKSQITGKITTPPAIKTADNIYSFEQLFKAVLKYSNFMICPSAMVRTEVYKNTVVIWRKELFATSADLDIWFRIALENQIGILPRPLMNYRISQYHGSAFTKRSVARADFFLVMDYYLKQSQIVGFLTKQDRKNYEELELRNLVMRATNLFMEGNLVDAKELCSKFFSRALFYAALKSKRGKLTLALNAMLHVFIFFNMKTVGRHVFSTLLGRLAR